MKSQVKNLELSVIMWFIMCSGLIGIAFNIYVHTAHTDAWMAPILGTIIGLIPLFIFLKIMDYNENFNINDSINHLFGKFGKVISLSLCLFVASFVIVYFYNLTNFISSEYLYITPKYFIAIMFIIPIIYMLLYEFHIISRSIMIFGFVALVLFMFGFFGLIFQTELTNVLPILKDGFIPPIMASLYHVCYIVLPLFLLTILSKKQIRNNEKFNKRMIITYLLSSLSICLIIYIALSTFGIELSILYQYPLFNILKRISVLTIFDRVESIIAIMWILFIYVSCVMGCFYIKESLFQVFELKESKKNKYIILSIIVLILWCSVMVFPNNTFVNYFLSHIYPFMIGIFFGLIPLGILVAMKFKKHK